MQMSLRCGGSSGALNKTQTYLHLPTQMQTHRHRHNTDTHTDTHRHTDTQTHRQTDTRQCVPSPPSRVWSSGWSHPCAPVDDRTLLHRDLRRRHVPALHQLRQRHHILLVRRVEVELVCAEHVQHFARACSTWKHHTMGERWGGRHKGQEGRDKARNDGTSRAALRGSVA